MESLVSILSSLILITISVRAARRWAKSPIEAALWGAGAGLLAALFVLVSVFTIYVFYPGAFHPPAISLRLSVSLFIGPIAGALMTVMLWRRAQNR